MTPVTMYLTELLGNKYNKNNWISVRHIDCEQKTDILYAFTYMYLKKKINIEENLSKQVGAELGRHMIYS